MRSASLPFGVLFGVELRLHLYTVVLLPVLMLLATVEGVSAGRGMLLYLLLLLAVAVREIPRALGRLYAGVHVERLIFTPIGALATYSVPDSNAEPALPRWLALIGPVANFGAAIVMAMLAFSVTSGVNFFQRELAGPAHLLRATIWVQIVLGGLHLLPASPLDAGALLREQFIRARGRERGTRSAAGLSQALGLGLIVLGGFSQEILLMLLGGTVLLLAQLEAQRVVAQTVAAGITVGDVMLSEWTSLSGSDTVHDALERSTHSLQESFPVVRGTVIVGSVTREALLLALRSEGNTYVQGTMSRELTVASPEDSLVGTVQRISQTKARGNILPVMRGEQVVGILTPQSLSPAMMSLGRARRHLLRAATGRTPEQGGDRNG